MHSDLALISGLALGVLAIPALLTSISEGRPPRVSMLSLLIAFGLLGYALVNKPGGYTLGQIPDVFFSVLSGLF